MEKISSVAEALQFLMERDRVTPYKVSEDTKIPKSSIYALMHQATDKVSLSTISLLAEYFHEDVNIFFGVEKYVPPIELDARERELLTLFRRLNEEGKQRSEEYIDGLCLQKKFLK